MIGIVITKKHNKRFPRKHHKLINNKSIFLYTIEAALKSKLDELYIVTDDEEIINESKKYKKIKTLLLTPDLSEIGSIPTILYALKKYNDNEKIMLLQVTSPLRDVEDVNKCIDIMTIGDIDFITSVFRIRDIIIENGAIFCAKLGKLKEIKNWYNDKTFFYLMPEERSIDIDYEYQYKIAKMLIEERE